LFFAQAFGIFTIAGETMNACKLVKLLLVVIVAAGFSFSQSACKTTKRKGCGCGADLNRMYKPRR
jgi:hypothetical protein